MRADAARDRAETDLRMALSEARRAETRLRLATDLAGLHVWELDLQRDEMRRLGFTEDYREGVAAFLEKRPANFTGK